MIPVLSPQAIREADAWTIANEPITARALMERAAWACTERLVAALQGGRFGGMRSILVVSGMGNNGGDGLAMAVLLKRAGYEVAAVRINHAHAPARENEVQWQRAADAGVAVKECSAAGDLDRLGADLIVDALFGTGLKAPLDGMARDAVEWMNAIGRPIVSIDLPSGLFAEDNSANAPGCIVRAALTLTLELPKLALLLPEGAAFVGEWETVPIGLDQVFLQRCNSPYALVEAPDATALVTPRSRFAHKGTFGHALIIGGSVGRMGAMVLASKAALRSGAGLVTAGVPGSGIPVLQAAAPEAMCAEGMGGDYINAIPEASTYSAIACGPGMGTHAETARALGKLLECVTIPMVIDADALNIISAQRELIGLIPEGAILTPHPGEFERLVGKAFATGYDRLQGAHDAAQAWKCVIVLKGAFTAICAPDGTVRFNPTGNAGMAKGGSGDALTGLLAGLLAQGYHAIDACTLGVYLHGLAGDRSAARLGQEGMTAMDLIADLPNAWMALGSVGTPNLRKA